MQNKTNKIFQKIQKDFLEDFLKNFNDNPNSSPKIIYYRDEMEKNLHILGLTKEANMKSVKQKYRELSKIYHPDRENGSVSEFRKIKKAYENIKGGF